MDDLLNSQISPLVKYPQNKKTTPTLHCK